jgi:Domain of unknown function (DUF4091)
MHSDSRGARLLTALAATSAVCLLFVPSQRPLASAVAGTPPSPAVWLIPSLERVGPNDPPGQEKDVRLAAALGETESFQIVVRVPGGDDTPDIKVEISDLIAAAGRRISGRQVQLYREGYIYIDSNRGSPDWHGANRPLGPGWYPDALIPFAQTITAASGRHSELSQHHLPANSNQPIWVDITVPRTGVPGQYDGTYSVKIGSYTATGRIQLEVWHFALPEKPFLSSVFLISKAKQLAVYTELLRHRLMPDSVPPALQVELIRDYGLGVSGLNFWSGASYNHCSMSAPPDAEAIRKAAAAQPPGLLLYDYSADEIEHCAQLFPSIREWARRLHAFGVKNLVTVGPVPELLDDGSGTGRSAVDIWAVLPDTYEQDRDNIQRALAKGDEVWSYNTEVQDPYSPKWELDFSPINFRIQPGFINQSLGLTGLLYWSVDRWSDDPWNDVFLREGHSSFPGDGALLYPGAPVGVGGIVPSMRLKWLRDGVDDYDYIELLKRAGHREFAMQIARRVGPDWKHWTRDPNLLEASRQKLGKLLDSLAAPTRSW